MLFLHELIHVLVLVKQFSSASSIETFVSSRYYSHVSSFCYISCLQTEARVHDCIFATLGLTIITRNYYTQLCTIHWSPHHGSSAKLVWCNGVGSPHCNAKVIEILKKDLPLLWNDSRLTSQELTQPKHILIKQLADPPINQATPPARILLQ